MTNYNQIASNSSIDRAVKSLIAHGIEAKIVSTVDELRSLVFKLIPKGAEVFTISSETLRLSGIADEINQSGRYQSVRNLLNQETDKKIKRQLGASPEYAIGSVQAITEDGHIWVVSATGSQLASYVYGAQKVIFVVGAQKIVKNDDAAMERIYDHTLELESTRTRAIFGEPSRIGKILKIIDDQPGRSTVYILKQAIGF